MSEPKPKGHIPEPTIRASLTNGFQVLLDDAAPLVVMAFGVFVIGTVARSLYFLPTQGEAVSALAYLLFAGPIELGMSFVCLRAVRSGRVNFDHMLSILPQYGALVFANALMLAILPGAAALLIVPGILFFCATRFVPFLILEDELGGAEAIIESIKLSRDCIWPLLGINAIGLAATAIGGISILGLIPALLWWNLSLASLYHSVVRPPTAWQIEDEEELEAGRLEAEREAAEEEAEIAAMEALERGETEERE
ncbi:MAG: hypothetical protein QF570_02830 [Myxococcota bacterium]|nr:hypothetical protein [Myxococcota bacterium]